MIVGPSSPGFSGFASRVTSAVTIFEMLAIGSGVVLPLLPATPCSPSTPNALAPNAGHAMDAEALVGTTTFVTVWSA